ncbi:hypothetical protein F2Q70_00003870 [Brassica cretica]|uniref:Uncharacterized protein n=1 Tax=Brassica cretica TaxID=69181 RepID=A0A8S9IJY3_BRACR|nr:hypothetical protein F2Q70_00003870 [Brassica cretica]
MTVMALGDSTGRITMSIESTEMIMDIPEMSFAQTKLVLEIYTKDEINEMLYGVCGAQEKNEDDFQMKLDGVYYPLHDRISWVRSEVNQHPVAEEISPASGFQVPASRPRVPVPGSGSRPPGLGPCLQPPASRPRRHDLHHKYRFLNLKKGVHDVHDQSSSALKPPRQGFAPRGPSSSTSSQPMNPCDYYQPDDEICSLQHVYNATCWLRP